LKSILLTGGTGLVGRDLVKRLLAEGYKIYLADRNNSLETHQNMEWIPVDMYCPPANFFNQLPDVDMVVHAGAAVNTSNEQDAFEIYRTVNMLFSEKLFQWCATRKNLNAVVYLSTLSSLQKPLLDIITETHPLAPLTLYSISKYWAEKALLQYSTQSSFRPVILRLSSPVAFNVDLLHDTVVKKWLTRARNGKKITVFGTGNRTQDFIATIDIAKAATDGLKSNKTSGIYNIASGSSIAMTALAELIGDQFNCEIEHLGEDSNENDRWNISIAKANHDFDFKPKYNSIEVIKQLISSIR
jgi:UDP-glucose 4-epimerase